MDMHPAPPNNKSQLVQYRGARRIKVPPADDSPLAYRENTLVSVFNDIYKHFINILYLPSERVVFPPADTGRHVLDVGYLRDELRLAPRVISLLERLPYVNGTTHCGPLWYPEAKMIDYRDNRQAREARDPNNLSWFTTSPSGAVPDSHDLGYMRPTDVALAFPSGKYQQIILDTEANSIRLMTNWWELPVELLDEPLEVPQHKDHYRNHAGYHAPSVLRTYYEDLLSLEVYPLHSNDEIGTYNEPTIFIISNILRRHFGYPHGFRRDAWAKMVYQVEDEAMNMDEKLMDEQAARNHARDPEDAELDYGEERMLEATQEVVKRLGLI